MASLSKAPAALEPYALEPDRRKRDLRDRFREHCAPSPDPRLEEYRSEYHRDRDRIVWSRAFKRLQHKTQVFPHYVEDHYRRRLTHALEVAQIATTLARAFKLNEPATEAIALGHDLGHAPFGHAGEKALNEVLLAYRKKPAVPTDASWAIVPIFGFDHCVHGVEVVSRIEREYRQGKSGYFGLNLTFDVRDGILKHMFDRAPSPKRPLSTVGAAVKFDVFRSFEKNRGSLEAQCVYFADKLAYLLGDIEDGIRGGIFPPREVEEAKLIRRIWDEYRARRREYAGDVPAKPRIADVDDFLDYRRKALTAMILDCVDATEKRLDENEVRSVADVFGSDIRIVDVSEEVHQEWSRFHNDWMKGRLYCNASVKASEYKAVRIVQDLFEAYIASPELIEKKYRDDTRDAYREVGVTARPLLDLITVRNYVAGMTDPYASSQHARLFMSTERVHF